MNYRLLLWIIFKNPKITKFSSNSYSILIYSHCISYYYVIFRVLITIWFQQQHIHQLNIILIL